VLLCASKVSIVAAREGWRDGAPEYVLKRALAGGVAVALKVILSVDESTEERHQGTSSPLLFRCKTLPGEGVIEYEGRYGVVPVLRRTSAARAFAVPRATSWQPCLARFYLLPFCSAL